VTNAERKLLPGMVASVAFGNIERPSGNHGDRSRDSGLQPNHGPVPMIPVTAVQRKADGSLFVWTISGDSTAHRATVRTGETMGNRIAITDGISEGGRIVTEGYQKLSENTKVVY
jgi:multidrug efflux pump subunit AcrA (membrane-fusion protein)